jgi:hypothetical protein
MVSIELNVQCRSSMETAGWGASIAASSPQTKGRMERRHGVLQDRLVKELR